LHHRIIGPITPSLSDCGSQGTASTVAYHRPTVTVDTEFVGVVEYPFHCRERVLYCGWKWVFGSQPVVDGHHNRTDPRSQQPTDLVVRIQVSCYESSSV
jgi:hypothetical protein